jgi:hypothetical protein
MIPEECGGVCGEEKCVSDMHPRGKGWSRVVCTNGGALDGERRAARSRHRQRKKREIENARDGNVCVCVFVCLCVCV